MILHLQPNTAGDEQLWRALWTHAAQQVVSAYAAPPATDRLASGAGWGLRHQADRRRAVLLHPAGAGRPAGDLALTVLGSGTQVIPRLGRPYPEYIEQVADIFATTADHYFNS